MTATVHDIRPRIQERQMRALLRELEASVLRAEEWNRAFAVVRQRLDDPDHDPGPGNDAA